MELELNCGFARVAIHQLSVKRKGEHLTLTHMTERNQEFQMLFREHGIENSIFERVKGRESTFDPRCK